MLGNKWDHNLKHLVSKNQNNKRCFDVVLMFANIVVVFFAPVLLELKTLLTCV